MALSQANCALKENSCTAGYVLGPKRLNELPEVRFEFPFQPDWQIGNGIFTCTTGTLKD